MQQPNEEPTEKTTAQENKKRTFFTPTLFKSYDNKTLTPYKPISDQNILNRLPAEMWAHIISFIQLEDQRSLMQTCEFFRALVNDHRSYKDSLISNLSTSSERIERIKKKINTSNTLRSFKWYPELHPVKFIATMLMSLILSIAVGIGGKKAIEHHFSNPENITFLSVVLAVIGLFVLFVCTAISPITALILANHRQKKEAYKKRLENNINYHARIATTNSHIAQCPSGSDQSKDQETRLLPKNNQHSYQ